MNLHLSPWEYHLRLWIFPIFEFILLFSVLLGTAYFWTIVSNMMLYTVSIMIFSGIYRKKFRRGLCF